MSIFNRRTPLGKDSRRRSSSAETALQWQFEEDDDPASGAGKTTARSGPRPVNRFRAAFRRPAGERRRQSVQQGLAQALEEWWAVGKLPPLDLLRDGLLALEAGHALGEGERTLLLRSALFYGRGTITALRHQSDPERTASVLADLLLDSRYPLPPGQVLRLVQTDQASHSWLGPLQQQLREVAAAGLDPRRTLALAALLHLGEAEAPEGRWMTVWESQASRSGRPSIPPHRRQSREAVTLGLWGLVILVAVLGGVSLWQMVSRAMPLASAQVVIPAGTYLIADPDTSGEGRLVELAGYTLDRTEVTNRAYRRCYERGACPWPSTSDSASRANYFLRPEYDDFPVVNVSWDNARTYCEWTGRRLPSADEWEVAASSAMTIYRRYRYPWGDVYDGVRANGAAGLRGDTQRVGQYSPAGDSPFGAADMAGNVAEWTASTGERPNTYLVKGGSFRDDAAQLRADRSSAMPANSWKPWLGFRCATTAQMP